MNDFLGLVGVALIIFAFVAPLSYCTMNMKDVTDLKLACIQARGEWKSSGWGSSPFCTFPEQKP